MKIRSSLFLILFLVVYVGLAARTEACSCNNGVATCERIANYDAIFVGKVLEQRVDPEQKAENGKTTYVLPTEVSFVLQIEEKIQGVHGDRVVITTGNGDCGFPFTVGEQYLVFAGRASDGRLGTGICSGTKELEQARDDLLVLRGLPPKATGTRVYGGVFRYGPANPADRIQRLAGIPASLVGSKRTYRLLTDNAGEFEAVGLPAGKYRVSIEVPEYYLQENLTKEIVVTGCGCITLTFVAKVDNRVSGSVVDENGEALEGARVSLIPAGALILGWNDDESTADTDDEGKFSFAEVPPGRYLLGVNLNESPGRSFPYLSTFYPGATNRADAQVIDLGLGQKLTGMTFRVGDRLVQHKLGGEVVWPDGRPAKQAHVYLGYLDLVSEWRVTDGIDTDDEGRFTLVGFEGYDYLLGASLRDGQDGKPGYLAVHAPAVKLRLSEDRDGLRLVLSQAGSECDECYVPKPPDQKQ